MHQGRQAALHEGGSKIDCPFRNSHVELDLVARSNDSFAASFVRITRRWKGCLRAYSGEVAGRPRDPQLGRPWDETWARANQIEERG